MTALQDVKDYLASVGVPAGRYTDAALLQVIAVESAAQVKACRVPSVDLPSGLSLHFRASDLDTLTDGAAVSSWTSAAGTSVGTQGTGSAQPLKQTLDGRDLVRFDGADMLPLSGDALSWTSNLAAATFLIRAKRNSSTDRAFFGFSTPTIGLARLTFRAVGGIWKLGGRRSDADSLVEIGAGAADSSVHTFAGVVDYARATAALYVDGVLDASGAFQTAGVTSNTASAGSALGSQSDLGSPLVGDIYEFLAWPRLLTSAERLAAEDYLAGGGLPWPLREALCRRVQVNLAKRALPLGVIDQSSDGGGPSFVPRIDPEVRRLEAPYRKLVVG
jgi:hypothetical protein